jgi:hypothetical protein
MKKVSVTLDMVNRAKAKAGFNSMMTKYEILREIKNVLLDCQTTETDDIQDMFKEDQVNSKIYTKKLYIGADKRDLQENPEDMCLVKDIEYVSLSCSDPDFKSCLVGDIRVNSKNAYNEWVNVFASTFDLYTLRFLLYLMKEVMDVSHLGNDAVVDVLFEEFTDWAGSLKVTCIKDVTGFSNAFSALKKTCLER